MPIQQIFPFPHLANLLLTVLVLFIVVWPTGVVDVIPILRHRSCFLVLLALLAAPAWALFRVEMADIFII
jgi:hypothetical protein